MQLHHEFTVDAPIEVVWQLLLDIERVGPCLPGTEITEKAGDNGFKAKSTVRLGPVRMTYGGVIAIDEVDEAGHRVVMRASGTELRGQGTAEALITTTLVAEGGATQALAVTDLKLTGKAAQFGHGMIEDVSNHLMQDFVHGLAEAAQSATPAAVPAAPAAMSPPATAVPARSLSGIQLLLAVVRGRLRRLFSRRAG
jgi:carbon monoxide dehydrogenase subunit G